MNIGYDTIGNDNNFLSKLVVLTNNYSPDYAPFTVDKKGTLEEVPVQIRVSLRTLISR